MRRLLFALSLGFASATAFAADSVPQLPPGVTAEQLQALGANPMQALRDRAQQLSPEQRKAFMDQAKALTQSLTPEQRASVLGALRSATGEGGAGVTGSTAAGLAATPATAAASPVIAPPAAAAPQPVKRPTMALTPAESGLLQGLKGQPGAAPARSDD